MSEDREGLDQAELPVDDVSSGGADEVVSRSRGTGLPSVLWPYTVAAGALVLEGEDEPQWRRASSAPAGDSALELAVLGPRVALRHSNRGSVLLFTRAQLGTFFAAVCAGEFSDLTQALFSSRDLDG